VLVLAAKAVHARQKPNRVARILVLKILYSLEPAGTEWPAALLWGTTPSGPPAWASHHEKYTGRGPSGATADRVVLKRTQLRAACVFKPRQRPARNTKATIKNNRCLQSTSCFTNYPSLIT